MLPFLRKGHSYYNPAFLLHHPPREVWVNDHSLQVENKPIRARVAEQEKMPITINESSFQAYMTQEITKPTPVPETELENFDTEDEDIWIGDSGASSCLTNENRSM